MAHFFLMAMSKSRSRRSPGDVEKSISEMTGGNVDPAWTRGIRALFVDRSRIGNITFNLYLTYIELIFNLYLTTKHI